MKTSFLSVVTPPPPPLPNNVAKRYVMGEGEATFHEGKEKNLHQGRRLVIFICLDNVCPWLYVNNWFRLVLPKWVATIVAVLLVVTMTRNIQLNCAKEVMWNMRASQGGCMFPCSLWKFTVVPLFLKNKLRCSPKFTFTEFPCSQKFRSMFPWSPKIFLTVPYNSSHIIFFLG